MKKQINDLLLKMQNGENCIGETANELLNLYSVSNRFINDSDLDTIKELRDLMEDVIRGDYKPDSFTNQPISNLIERLENGC
jgi:hypothetical protein